MKLSTSKPKTKKTKLIVTVKVKSSVPATGRVKVRLGSKTYSATLKNGTAKIKLAKQPKKGSKKLKISYPGSTTVSSAKTVSRSVRWR